VAWVLVFLLWWHPIYISEISTPATRGRLGALYQFNIVFGILIAFLSNYFLQGVGGSDDWRWMLGVLAVPALLYTILVFGVSESPRWLITKRNDLAKAKQIMLQIGVVDVEAETASIIESNRHDTTQGNTTGFFNGKHKKIIYLAFMIAFFNQLSGINFILYYAPEISWKKQASQQKILYSIRSPSAVSTCCLLLLVYS
jgi:MFS family permease